MRKLVQFHSAQHLVKKLRRRILKELSCSFFAKVFIFSVAINYKKNVQGAGQTRDVLKKDFMLIIMNNFYYGYLEMTKSRKKSSTVPYK